PGGMLNAVGLANPGLATVRDHELPWLATHLRRARVIVNVAGATVDDYVAVIRDLADLAVITAFELNASCPNTSAGGLEFGATPEGVRELVRRCRGATTKPITVKLSPVVPDLTALAQVARDEGADRGPASRPALGQDRPRAVRARRGGAGAGARARGARRARVPRFQVARHSERRRRRGGGGTRAGRRHGHGTHAGRAGDARRSPRGGGRRGAARGDRTHLA